MAVDLEKIVSALIILLFLAGIAFFRTPRTARWGNRLNIIAYLAAVVLVIIIYPLLNPLIALFCILGGGILGSITAARVSMLGLPQMIALQNGCGGTASFLIAYSELVNSGGSLETLARTAAVLGIIVGAATFSGSLVAAGKLAGKINQKPIFLTGHAAIFQCVIAAILILSVIAVRHSSPITANGLVMGVIALSVLAGTIFTISISGADMPIVISFLNATTGFAAAFCGIALDNYLLVGGGAVVGASGSLLTMVMCRAMNRSFISILFRAGSKGVHYETKSAVKETGDAATGNEASSMDTAVSLLKEARDVIIVPGYGMALSQAQNSVKALEEWLVGKGARVSYAIHPVAGRMPGHMNVLLAEVGVDYEKLFEMQAINEKFKNADLAIVIGACDVVNPAAIYKEGTPISGMPILNVQQTRSVMVLNYDSKPGFSGVDNPLYNMEGAVCLWGDARVNLDVLLSKLT